MRPPCQTCETKCGFLWHSQFNQQVFHAIAADADMPDCDQFKESTFHGVEGCRA